MKHLLAIAFSGAFLCSTAMAAGPEAAGAGTPQTLESRPAESTAASVSPGPRAEQLTTEDLFGYRVTNPERENLGTIRALVLDEEGRVARAVLAVGGFLGIGEKEVAIDWKHLQLHPEQATVVVDVTLAQLERAADMSRAAEGAGLDDRRGTTR